MKRIIFSLGNISILLSLLATGITVHAQGTAFTYQGRLTDSGAPFTGNAEFQATLWREATGGAALATNSPASVIAGVTNGLFVLPLDFGANFSGEERWLQLEVRTTLGPFTTLAPRHKLTSSPYAITAMTANNLSGVLSSANLGGSYLGALSFNNPANIFNGNGSGLTGINRLDSPGGGPARALAVNSLGHVAIGTNDSGAALQVAGGTLYANPVFRGAIVNNSAGISNMPSPVNVFVAGTRAYVTSYLPGSVEIFDISNALQPVLIGQAVDDSINPSSPFTKLGGASGIFVSNNIAYVTAETEHSLTIMNVSDPANPTKLAEVVNGTAGVTNLNTPTGVLVIGNRAYVTAFFSSAICIFDVSNPASPVLTRQILDDSVQPGSTFTRLQWPYQMTVAGTKLYVAARADHAVNILDVANPANPTLVTSIVDASVVPSSPFTRLRNANWVEVIGNTAYVAAGAFTPSLGSLTIIDVSNPASPIKLAEVNDDSVQTNSSFTKLSGAWAVKVVGNVVFVTCVYDNAVTVIDVSNPGNPRLLKEFVNGRDGINTLSFTEGLAASGDTVYVAGDGSAALNIFSAHSTLGLKVDGFVGIGTATPRTELDVAGTVSARAVQWASSSQLSSDQGGSIELGDSSLSNTTPYIDFHFGATAAQNYNVRLINDASSQLSLFGNFGISGGAIVDKADFNAGSLSPGLVFGNLSGEGIASKRTAGVGQWGMDFYTAFQNRMSIANNGNVGIGTVNPGQKLHVAGPYLRVDGAGNEQGYIGGDGFGSDVQVGSLNPAITTVAMYNAGSGSPMNLYAQTFNFSSDRNQKHAFKEVNPRNVLEKVLSLPITEWSYKNEKETRHIGPVAQDFKGLFNVGKSSTSISTVDAHGVTLAAIQGLNQKLSEELKRRDAENAELKARLSALEKRFESNTKKGD